MERRHSRGIIRGSLRLGRLAVPVWAVAAGAMAVAAVAGQAVGPVLQGSTGGTANIVVGQAVVLDTDIPLGMNPVAAGTDWVTTRNDEGTGFTVAIETHTGQRDTVTLYFANHSAQDAAAVLQLDVPAGFDVEVDKISNGVLGNGTIIREAQMTRDTWLMNVGASAGVGDDDGLRITIESKDDLQPGFYSLAGRIVQIAG